MLREGKNLKDTQTGSIKDTSPMPVLHRDGVFSLGSYTKTDKLITALYMVTDIIDKDEPLRNKLRTLGADIISDAYYMPSNISVKISEIMSFLDIASAVNIISEMNCNILRKEFGELDQSIKELTGNTINTNKHINLSGFFENSSSLDKGRIEEGFRPPLSFGHLPLGRGRENPKGHTSIGVQKGSTLMKALGGVVVSDTKRTANSFDILKKQRRNEIINLITKKEDGVTITDIKNGAFGSLISCSEKTLQRELISMVKDGVLYKTGEKRWSKYFVK